MKNHTKVSAIILAIIAAIATTALLMKDRINIATTPQDLSLKDWKKALIETKNALTDKKLPFFAAGVAYFSTLAFFPLMVALVAIAAMIMDAEQMAAVTTVINQYAPKDLASLVTTQLENAAQNQSGSLMTAIVAIAISLFSVSGAAQNLIQALNTAYSAEENRGFIRLRLVSLALTFGLIVFIGFALALLILNPSLLTGLGVPVWLAELYPVLRWLTLISLLLVALAALYRYAPDRLLPKWQWVSWGSLISTAMWTLATVLFFIYVQYFANFSDTYSLFAGIIALMLWLNLSALVVLIGAQINQRLESKTLYPTASPKS